MNKKKLCPSFIVSMEEIITYYLYRLKFIKIYIMKILGEPYGSCNNFISNLEVFVFY